MELRSIKDQSPLIQAIFSRNAEDVALLLEHNESVNAQDQDQSTPLHAAAYLGDVHVMELLINAGANVNSKDQGLLTPLHRAAASRNERAVELLLKHKAELNARDKFWHTPLHMAAANWATGCAAALIPYVCSLDVTDKLGRTPLHHAAHRGHAEMVNLFLRKGASANAKDKKDRQPIHWAAHLGHLDVMKLLMSYISDVACKDKHGYTPLHVAAASGHLDVVRCLLRLQEEPDEPNSFGNTALHMACHTGQDSVATELVNCGANINQPNHEGNTPLHLATISSSGVLCLELLVNNGADVNVQNKEGKSALHMAAMHGRFTSSQILIQNGGEIDCVDINGNTPLHVAARYGQELLTSTLLTNGAARGRRGVHGMLPLHFAALFGFPDCCRKLLSNGQFYNVIQDGQIPTLEFDINTQDDYGRTCLHAAASGGNVECLNLLVNSGAELDIKDDLRRSPLHYSAANGNSQCTFSLVRAGAELNEADLTGCSPLHYAAASHTFCGGGTKYEPDLSEERKQEASLCLDFLLDNGANPTLKNSRGYSAVHYAAAYGNKQHLELAYYGHCEALHLLCETLVSLDVRDIGGQTALHLAAKRGFSKCVAVLLEHQASYTLKEYKQKRTALHAAAAEGQVDCLLLLVNREQSSGIIDAQDTQGQTALILAALGRHTDCVHILLEKNANPDAADKRGFTAMHRAAMLGSEDSVLALLEHGASALCRDAQGKTPLHLAASCGHTKLLHILLGAAKKADPLDSMLDFRGYTPTHWAAYHGHEGCLHHLLENKLYSNQEGNRFTPLHCALINGHDAAAGLLVKTIGSYIVHTNDTKGRTPLHAAAYSGSVAGLQLVLGHGAQVNAVDHSGCSAVMVAANCGQTMAVEFLLLKAKPDLTLVDVNNNTALHLACSKGHEMCALLLLGEITDSSLINARNNSLQMPLHIAARKGLATVVQVLLSRGAAVMAVDEDGHTPALACAPNKNVADCLALILSTMRPFPPREADAASPFSPILKNCSIAATCGSNGSLCHA
ncbi:serine/threonine-protein phosphatase 6 regulatory ankyrin repeat subunit C-like isoform X2 [Gambusia affinis]|uniref:serine/threonine-protein phosphatase 6 regulatory ankyrin repeat subunit C-like isoform X2 n=1 Tax=Gambusia affinis TaxID=33528 RepID=UPI001CDCE5C7|nr:serine/threonine-protein phosphatase 6 regulatory ankyrin repeat subunit C-like isoform X2 [Gambusia affinis]